MPDADSIRASPGQFRAVPTTTEMLNMKMHKSAIVESVACVGLLSCCTLHHFSVERPVNDRRQTRCEQLAQNMRQSPQRKKAASRLSTKKFMWETDSERKALSAHVEMFDAHRSSSVHMQKKQVSGRYADLGPRGAMKVRRIGQYRHVAPRSCKSPQPGMARHDRWFVDI